jgi:hypothetical protein
VNERYHGTAGDKSVICSFLKAERLKPPELQESALTAVVSLKEALRSDSLVALDPELFDAVGQACVDYFTRLWPSFVPLGRERFLVGVLRRDARDGGGFHSDYAMGFRYISMYGFARDRSTRVDFELTLLGFCVSDA